MWGAQRGGRRPRWRIGAENGSTSEFWSTTDTESLDQSLVAAFIGALEIVKKLATLGHKLQQSPSRVIVLNVLLEVLSEIADALRQDPDLYLRRPGIAGLFGVRFDDFRFTLGCDRHRQRPSCRPALPCSPARLNTRLGTISPRSTSARATRLPEAVT